MNLLDATERYRITQRLSSRTILHNATRFTLLSGVLVLQDITTAAFETFRNASKAAGLSNWTIEKTVTDVLTVLAANSFKALPGCRFKRPRPRPCPVPIEVVATTWQHALGWLRQWMVISYWTGLRLADSLRLQLKLDGIPTDVLCWVSQKTGHLNQWPVPRWLLTHLQPMSLPYGHANDHGMTLVRIAIERATHDAKIDVWHPKHLRQRSLTEWSRANGMAGAIIHGSGLSGVMRHYIDPLVILSSAGERLRLPADWRPGEQDGEDGLLLTFRALDPSGQRLIRETAQRLAGAG